MVTILLAPSKTMDFVSAWPYGIEMQQPIFLNQAARIAGVLKEFDEQKLSSAMSISQPLSKAAVGHYADWSESKHGRPALWTYVGDVYKGIQAKTLTLEDARWAQEHIVIASGLYGLIRPFDGIQAYRLEMKAAVGVGKGKNISQFWENKLPSYIDSLSSEWVCNCSSAEYSKPVLKGAKTKIVTPVFYDKKPNGLVGQVPIYSKMMRGVMARWMIDNRVENPDDLQKFTAHGYHYDSDRSVPNAPAFSRAKMVPLQFD